MKVVIGSMAWVDKRQLLPLQLEMIKKSLTVEPTTFGKGEDDFEIPKKIYLYKEVGNNFGMAREYFLEKRRPEHEIEDATTKGTPLDWEQVHAKLTPFPAQVPIINTFYEGFTNKGWYGGILQAATGTGKTQMALMIAAKLKVPVLVLVHKEFLMNQWLERIQGSKLAKDHPDYQGPALEGVNVGIIQGQNWDYKDKHIVIGMMQTLYQNKDKFPVDLYQHFGLIIADESHRIASFTWSQIIPNFPARYRLLLSATPRRKDGAENVFFYHGGPIRYKADAPRLKPKIRRIDTDFKLYESDKFNPKLLQRPLLLRFLCSSKKRNAQIVEQIIKAVKSGRRPLVLSERLNHIDKLSELLLETWAKNEVSPPPSIGFCKGGNSEQDDMEAKEKTVMFATYQYVAEAFDHPVLDTLFLASPIGDVQQAAGRILRPHPLKKEPIVVDFVDPLIPLCEKYWNERYSFYLTITDA